MCFCKGAAQYRVSENCCRRSLRGVFGFIDVGMIYAENHEPGVKIVRHIGGGAWHRVHAFEGAHLAIVHTVRQISVTVVALPKIAAKDEPPIQAPASFLSDNLVDLHLLSATAGAHSCCG